MSTDKLNLKYFYIMYLQLKESDKFVSPVIYIHCDEEEALDFIKKWREELSKWAKKETIGTPLARLDVNTCIVDLIHKLGNYFIETTGVHLGTKDKITGWIRLFNYEEIAGENILVINIHTGVIVNAQ